MGRITLQLLRWLVILVAAVALGSLLLRRCGARPPPPSLPPIAAAPEAAPSDAACAAPPYAPAARDNTASLFTLVWAPFRRTEQGWAIYAPLIGHTLGTACAPESERFAASLAAWQGRHGLPATGRLDEATFQRIRLAWYAERPVVLTGAAGCMDSAPAAALATAAPSESYGGKTIELRGDALAAYRRMVRQARRDLPGLARDPRLLTIFSGYRNPEADAARCATEGNCDNVARSTCSPHRTGRAIDVFLGSAPGLRPDSSADPNRLYMSRTPAYRWLVAHADTYGFYNYPFEPWHWEWKGGD